MAADNEALNVRIDLVLDRNRRAEQVIITLSVMIFLLGMGLIVTAIAVGEPVYAIPSLVIEAFLYWPVNQIIRIRKENIALSAAPVLISTLPPDQAATEMVKLLENVRNA